MGEELAEQELEVVEEVEAAEAKARQVVRVEMRGQATMRLFRPVVFGYHLRERRKMEPLRQQQ